MAGPEQFGKLNVWAVLKKLVENFAGPFVNAGAPTSGASGTFNGFAGIGALLLDITNANLYINTGTKASPTWTSFSKSIQAGNSVAKFTAALTPASVAASTSAEQLFTVTGIAVGDAVFVNKPTAQAGLGIVGIRASAVNEVGITFGNFTVAAITPTAAETYTFGVIR